MLPRLYREAPLNGIWEGSGNIVCLDVLRAVRREPSSVEALLAEVEPSASSEPRLAAQLERVKRELLAAQADEGSARRLSETLALLLQADLLLRFAPAAVAEAFCRTRLSDDAYAGYGCLPAGVDIAALLERATLARH